MNLMITEKLDHAAEALSTLFISVSNLIAVAPTMMPHVEPIKIEIARIAAMIDNVREQVKQEKSNGQG